MGGYTLTPADAAVVKQNGNVFTVSRMTKDCTLTVQFDPRTPSTVHFSVPEGVTAPADAAGYTGDKDARLAEMCNFVKEQDPRYCCMVKVEQSYASALPEEDQ